MGQRQTSKPLPKCLFSGRVSEVIQVSLQATPGDPLSKGVGTMEVAKVSEVKTFL